MKMYEIKLYGQVDPHTVTGTSLLITQNGDLIVYDGRDNMVYAAARGSWVTVRKVRPE